MISKELLSEVLNFDSIYNVENGVTSCRNVTAFATIKITYFIGKEDEPKYKHVNVHELAHKCKEWAVKKGYVLIEYPLIVKIHKEGEIEATESISDLTTTLHAPLRVFEACQWILERKDK